jgi:hypothetical protein
MEADDLTVVRGIGPSVAAALAAAGVNSFDALAALAPAQIFDLVKRLPGLSIGKITVQDWAGQAATLAAGRAGQRSEPLALGAEEQRLLESFVLTLAARRGRVVRSSVRHAKTKDEDTWPDWDADRLVAFIEERSHLHLS